MLQENRMRNKRTKSLIKNNYSNPQKEDCYFHFGNSIKLPVSKSIRKKLMILPLVSFILLSGCGILIWHKTHVDEIPAIGIETNEDEILKEKVMSAKDNDFASQDDNKKALEMITHKVASGETILSIAGKYGISLETICGSNKLPSYDMIQIGTVLKFPNKDGLMYKMGPGENVASVAGKYKISIDKVISANQIINPDLVNAGTEIFLPEAKPLNVFNGWLWPVANKRITSSYGWRTHPISNTRQFHSGMDIRARYESVKASKYGKVTFAGWMGGYGYCVVIAHPNGWKTLYGHLSKIKVHTGQYVKQGQVIARSGNTGYSSGPHLHFEIRKDGVTKNPRSFLKK